MPTSRRDVELELVGDVADGGVEDGADPGAGAAEPVEGGGEEEGEECRHDQARVHHRRVRRVGRHVLQTVRTHPRHFLSLDFFKPETGFVPAQICYCREARVSPDCVSRLLTPTTDPPGIPDPDPCPDSSLPWLL